MQQDQAAQQQQVQKRLKDTNALVNAYADFFNHISLRKGWKTVPFKLDDLKPLFWAAALIVVKLRADLDQAMPGFKMRMVDGSAREYMWSITDDPAAGPESRTIFIREVVHATFKDNRGYVEGLTAERVQTEIDSAR
jgi:hypothetical protein